MSDPVPLARALLSEDPDPETRAELEDLLARVTGGDEAARRDLADRFTGPLEFGTAGLRGRVEAGLARMNRLAVIKATWGFGSHLLQASGAEARTRGVVIGFDGRHSSRRFAEDAAAVLAGLGIPVRLFPDPVPTPLLAFSVPQLRAAGGVMVTASHNPPWDNGYKVYLATGGQIIPARRSGPAGEQGLLAPVAALRSGVPGRRPDGVLRLNYVQFYQQPNLQDLYVSYRFLEYKVKTGGYFVGFGNPNLRPERTTAYEVGIQRQIGERARVELTTYYKDVKDLVEISNIPSSPKSFSSYRNRDFATIKGLDVGVAVRAINHLSGSLSYSLSFAQGTGSVSQTQRNIAWVGTETPKQTAPLDFYQRHKFSLNLDYRFGAGEGPLWGGRRWLQNSGINALLNVASGTPFTYLDDQTDSSMVKGA